MPRLAALLCISLLAACVSGGGGGAPLSLFLISIPQGLQSEEVAVWRISIMSEAGPFTIAYDFGGGAEPNSGSVTSPQSNARIEVKMRNSSSKVSSAFTYRFTVTDGGGQGQTRSGSYTLPPGHNVPPVIEVPETHFDPASALLYVYATDADGDPLTATLEIPPELLADPATPDQPEDDLVALYHLRSPAVFAPEISTEIVVTVTDSNTESDSLTVPVTLPAQEPLPNTLYAIAQETSAAPGVPVKVLVLTGPLSSPFLAMTSVGITIDEDASLMPGSFNAGDLGEGDYEPDGIWSTIAPHGFLLSPDDLPSVEPMPEGREVWMFHLTPDNGSALESAQGALFNFEFTFGLPGVKTIGLIESYAGVNRTYYSDESATEHFWLDLTNDHLGVPHVIQIE